MIFYKIQHSKTKLFNKKRVFYWNEASRWDAVGTSWDSLSDIAKYLTQFAKRFDYDTGVDISDWRIVEFNASVSNITPALQVIQYHNEH